VTSGNRSITIMSGATGRKTSSSSQSIDVITTGVDTERFLSAGGKATFQGGKAGRSLRWTKVKEEVVRTAAADLVKTSRGGKRRKATKSTEVKGRDLAFIKKLKGQRRDAEVLPHQGERDVAESRTGGQRRVCIPSWGDAKGRDPQKNGHQFPTDSKKERDRN